MIPPVLVHPDCKFNLAYSAREIPVSLKPSKMPCNQPEGGTIEAWASKVVRAAETHVASLAVDQQLMGLGHVLAGAV